MIELSTTLFNQPDPFARLFGRYRQFDYVEVIDWYVRGCPDGEWEYIPGILDKMSEESRFKARGSTISWAE